MAKIKALKSFKNASGLHKAGAEMTINDDEAVALEDAGLVEILKSEEIENQEKDKTPPQDGNQVDEDDPNAKTEAEPVVDLKKEPKKAPAPLQVKKPQAKKK